MVYSLAGEALSDSSSARRRTYSRMPAPNRAASLPARRRASGSADRAVLYRAGRPAAKAGSKLRRAGDVAKPTTGADLAGRLRALQPTLRSRIGRREALLEISRAVHTTLEPGRVAEILVERASTWVPAPCWAVVSSDGAGQLSVLAERGLESGMGPAVYAIAGWVMEDGGEFMTANLRADARVADQPAATVVAFPLSCRGRRVA